MYVLAKTNSAFPVDPNWTFTVNGMAPAENWTAPWVQTVGSSKEVVVEYHAVPEPGTALLALGVLGLLRTKGA